MSFTRFHDDPARIEKTNLEITSMNDYIFNVPGNTSHSSVYFEDPHLRMQKNGNTLCRNMVEIESELRTMDRVLCRDHKGMNDYVKQQYIKQYVQPKTIHKTISKESRASHPAWMLKGTNTHRTEYLFHNPQSNVEIPFLSNLDTNVLEKDYYNKYNKS
tara:strand:+ start:968 stop:1444 length:477 start_codon:yes stop_codon:yes gene_type:complete